MDTRYIIMTASAKMPMSCWGRYARVAVVETDLPEGQSPKMISKRARGLIRIVETWERLNVGTTEKCAFQRARTEAQELIWDLEAGSA